LGIFVSIILSPMSTYELKKLALEVALSTLGISYRKKIGHVGSSMAISDLLSVLYFDRLNITRQNLNDMARDRFILSKGHAAAALYAVLHKKGILSAAQFESFAENGGLCEHPEIKTPGVEMTSGSLGHGLAFGAGIAWGLMKLYDAEVANKNLDPSSVSLAKKAPVKKSSHSRSQSEAGLNFISSPHRKVPQVYVLISDGECGEGSVWEAALFASRMKLDNLTVILDNDGWQCFGETEKITHLAPLAAKWRAFGFAVAEVDGHNIREIQKTFRDLPVKPGHPTMIIADTKSGHGIPSIEDKLIGHYHVFSQTEYADAVAELSRRYRI
jgi:transketolase